MTYPTIMSGTPSGDASRTPATVVPRAQGGTGVTTTPSAPASFTPANPTATSSASLVMTGVAAIATALVAETIGARFGTGVAPANGAAVTGTRFGTLGDPTVEAAAVGQGLPFTFTAVLTLVAGTTYWFDVALATANASDAASVTNVGMSFAETS